MMAETESDKLLSDEIRNRTKFLLFSRYNYHSTPLSSECVPLRSHKTALLSGNSYGNDSFDAHEVVLD